MIDFRNHADAYKEYQDFIMLKFARLLHYHRIKNQQGHTHSITINRIKLVEFDEAIFVHVKKVTVFTEHHLKIFETTVLPLLLVIYMKSTLNSNSFMYTHFCYKLLVERSYFYEPLRSIYFFPHLKPIFKKIEIMNEYFSIANT